MNIRQSLLDHLDPDFFIGPSGQQPTQDSLDLGRSIDQAFAAPLNYPPFEQSIFPGDKLAIALQSGLPAANSILQQMILQLEKMAFSLDDLIVVISSQSAEQFGFTKTEIANAIDPQLEALTPDHAKLIEGRLVAFHIHNPENQVELSYLAANEGGQPVYLSRRLVDADVIIPIGFSTPSGATDLGCLYPEFSSAETKQRFHSGEMNSAQIQDEVRLANDTAGSFSAVQLVSGPGQSLQQVFFGMREEVCQLAQQETRRLWEVEASIAAPAVVATIESTLGKPDWDDFVRALLAAHQLAESTAPLIVWSSIQQSPTKGIRSALLAPFQENPTNKLSVELNQLSDILRDHPVYLHAELSRDEVESLGLGYLEDAQQIRRICHSLDHCLILRDAHRCQIKGTADQGLPSPPALG